MIEMPNPRAGDATIRVNRAWTEGDMKDAS